MRISVIVEQVLKSKTAEKHPFDQPQQIVL